MTFSPEPSPKEPLPWGMIAVLAALWALMFLPGLRTNPNWYGDEGVWLEASWRFAHGEARVGAVRCDFLFPYPYPPLYLLVNGALLRLFGNEILVSRALGVVTALAAAGLLFWIGARLRDCRFGFLCAAALLVWPEGVMNFRWARAHPMAGTLALASVGFLLRYVQEKRLRDIALAGLMCSLAMATCYWAYPLIAAVIVTALLVEPADGAGSRWPRVLVAAGAAGAYGVLFVAWYALGEPGGLTRLLEQVGRLNQQAKEMMEGRPTILGEVGRWLRNLLTLWRELPWPDGYGQHRHDLWLAGAGIGLALFPVARFRLWLWFWLLTLAFAVLRGRDGLPFMFYPAMVFAPLLAVGFGGLVARLEQWTVWCCGRRQWLAASAPGIAVLVAFGAVSLRGSLTHFRSRIDVLTVSAPADAEAAARFINTHSATEDLVLIPDQLYWLVRTPRAAQPVQAVAWMEQGAEYFGGGVPRDAFAFGCDLGDARYLVVAAGGTQEQPTGIDALYWFRQPSFQRLMATVEAQKWPKVFRQGDYVVYANPALNRGR
jgi:hypothetical protein